MVTAIYILVLESAESGIDYKLVSMGCIFNIFVQQMIIKERKKKLKANNNRLKNLRNCALQAN